MKNQQFSQRFFSIDGRASPKTSFKSIKPVVQRVQFHPDDLSSKYHALAWQGSQLVGAFKGIQGVIDFVFQDELSETRREAYLMEREQANISLARQIGCVDICEKQRKQHIWSKRQLQDMAIDLLRSPTVMDYSNLSTKDISQVRLASNEDNAEKEYDEICDLIDKKFDIDPTPICVLAWEGYARAGFDAFCHAYEGYRLSWKISTRPPVGITSISPRETGRCVTSDISLRQPEREHSVSVSMRATLQGFCFNAFQNKKLMTHWGKRVREPDNYEAFLPAVASVRGARLSQGISKACVLYIAAEVAADSRCNQECRRAPGDDEPPRRCRENKVF